MSFAEDQLVALLERQGRPKPMTSMSFEATGSMWLGLNSIDGPFLSNRRAAEIVRAVLFVTHVNQNDFLSHRRSQHIAEARQLAYWFMRQFTRLSTTQIGRFVGNRDHATVLHGIKRVAQKRKTFGPRARAVAEVLKVKVPDDLIIQ